MAQYKFGNENVVIVDYHGHSKLINVADMAQYDDVGRDDGQPPKLIAFNGEQALTGAIIEVSEEKQNKIYFIAGQGRPGTDFRRVIRSQDLPGPAKPENGPADADERPGHPGRCESRDADRSEV